MVVAGGSGNVDVFSDLCRIADLPVWVAHSEDDANVPISGDAEIVAGLESCGSTSVEFVTFQGLDHGQSIRFSYAGPDLYQWMLEQVP